MIREVKTFEYTCEKCGYVLVAAGDKFSCLPKGWKSIKAPGYENHPDHLSRWLDVCPACIAEDSRNAQSLGESNPPRR